MAFALVMLMASRFLLGMGEGGGFPAATRVVAEWFPVNERSTAMGIINAGTAVGAVIAPWLIFLVMNYTGWFGLAPWRWVFFLSGALGLLWTVWWCADYRPLDRTAMSTERQILAGQETPTVESARLISLARIAFAPRSLGGGGREIFKRRRVVFLSYSGCRNFCWTTFQIKFNAAASIGWIPYAASGVGCLVGGGFSSWLLKRGCFRERVAQTRAGRERGADAVGDVRAATAFRRLGDFYFQPRVFRPTIVVHAGDDFADGHDFPARRRHARRASSVLAARWAACCSARSSAGCATTVTATRRRSSSPVRCTSPRSF